MRRDSVAGAELWQVSNLGGKATRNSYQHASSFGGRCRTSAIVELLRHALLDDFLVPLDSLLQRDWCHLCMRQ